MKNKESTNYNAVRTMREIREQLSKEYLNDMEKEKKDLKKIRAKYRITTKKKILN